MKKYLFLICCTLCAITLSAQTFYKHSFGANLLGPEISYKCMVTPNFTIIFNAGERLIPMQLGIVPDVVPIYGEPRTEYIETIYGTYVHTTKDVIGYETKYGLGGCSLLTTNVNFAYQTSNGLFNGTGIDFYVGGGCNIASLILLSGYASIGVNAIVGLEYNSPRCPLVVGFDFQPGYSYIGVSDEIGVHGIDFNLTLSLRYPLSI